MSLRKLRHHLIGLTLVSPSFGVVIFDITEDSSGVNISIGGSVDTTGLTLNGSSNIDVSFILGSFLTLTHSNGAQGAITGVNRYLGASADIQVFLEMSIIQMDALGSLPNFAIWDEGGLISLLIPEAYSDPLDVPATVSIDLPGETFSSLGVIDGIVSSASWDTGLRTESIAFRTGSAVPEPSSILLFVVGALGLIRRRR